MNGEGDDEQSGLDNFGVDADGNASIDTHEREEPASGVASFPPELLENPDEILAPDERETGKQTALYEVFNEYLSEIDGKLIEEGWLFRTNKSIEKGKVDQSMLNHTRNLVFFLHRLATQAKSAGLQPISPKELRHLIALAVIHDYHKLREEDENREERFNITIAELKPFVEKIGLQEFSVDPSVEDSELSMRDFRSCAVDHHDTDNAKPTDVTLTWEDYRPFIRLADGMASSTTPEAATNTRSQKQFRKAFAGADVELAHHRIDHVSGIFTNLLSTAVSEYLENEFDYTLLTIYQDGCVYLAPSDSSSPEPTDEFMEAVYTRLSENISNSHPTYGNTDRLAAKIGTVNLGHYSLNPSEFFYAGAQRMIHAIVTKGVTDGSVDEEPTDSARESIEQLENDLGQEFDKTSQLYGMARFASTIRREILPVFLDDSGMKSDEGLRATGRVLGVSDDVAEELISLSPDVKDRLVAGNKWEFSYAFGQALLEKHGRGKKVRDAQPEIIDNLERGLASLADDDDWMDVLRESYSGGYRTEVVSFIHTHLRIDKGVQRETDTLTDTYEQYAETFRRGRICSLCSGGLSDVHNLGDMQPGEDITGVRGGFTNRDPIGSGKRDSRIICVPCQIELSLRGATSNTRYNGRLFIHLVPDYFYTPFAWRLFSRILNRFTGENGVRIGRLAEAVFDIDDPAVFNEVLTELTQSDAGRPMLDSLSGGFDQETQYGAQVVGYFKGLSTDEGNDTEFQFFGAFLALAVSSYTGMRIYLSSSPIPEMRSRDFPEFVKVGGGFTQVSEFYDDSVPLSGLQTRLQSAASLIKLGYALQGNSRNDSLFAKYLRVTRDEILPGSYLLKRAVQFSDEGPYIPALMRYAVTLDEQAGIKQFGSNMSNTPHNRITKLAELAYDAIRPASGHGRKPHRVERVFRESVKAVSKTGDQLSRDDYEMLVSGRLQKMLDRQAGDSVYPVSAEMSNAGTPLQERIEEYAAFFVDEILYGIANGRPSQLKRLKNNLADGFFGATLREESKFYAERDADSRDETDTELE